MVQKPKKLQQDAGAAQRQRQVRQPVFNIPDRVMPSLLGVLLEAHQKGESERKFAADARKMKDR